MSTKDKFPLHRDNGEIVKDLHIHGASLTSITEARTFEPLIIQGRHSGHEMAAIYLGNNCLFWIDSDGAPRFATGIMSTSATFVRYMDINESITIFGSAIPAEHIEKARQELADKAVELTPSDVASAKENERWFTGELPVIVHGADIPNIPNDVVFMVMHDGTRREKLCVITIYSGERWILGEAHQNVRGMHPPYWQFLRYATEEDIGNGARKRTILDVSKDYKIKRP